MANEMSTFTTSELCTLATVKALEIKVIALEKERDDREQVINQISCMEEEDGRFDSDNTLAEIFNICRPYNT